MTLEELADRAAYGTLVLESLPSALYQAYFEQDNQRHIVMFQDKPVSARSIGNIHEILGAFSFKKVVLRQHSAYDEMIGQTRGEKNTMTIPLDWSDAIYL